MQKQALKSIIYVKNRQKKHTLVEYSVEYRVEYRFKTGFSGF